jgi:hypothetical protein
MKKLERYIEFHRDKFDSLEPDDGHFIRFREKLGLKSFFSPVRIIMIAATILIAAFVSLNLLFFNTDIEANLPSELKETAYFYNLRSENLLFEIQNNRNMNSSEKQVILNDLRNSEKEYQSILNDLKNFPGDERLVNAFIDYHRSRAAFLEEIVKQINTVNLITI